MVWKIDRESFVKDQPPMTDQPVTEPLDAEALCALYGEPSQASLEKEFDHVAPVYRPFIERSPFAILATVGPGGVDISPRGDGPGFVRVADEKTLLLPDRPGNNRLDSLKNLLTDARLSLLFMVPGVGETLRVKGTGSISLDPQLLEGLAERGRPARSVLVVAVERVFFQCSRALVRSRIWDPETRLPRKALPSPGEMLQAASAGRIEAESYDRELPQRLAERL